MDLLPVQLLNGVVYGMLLFLTAAGLSLIFGLMNVVSLVHGSFFMLGAYFGLTIFNETKSFWVALALAPLPAAILGGILERIFLRPLYSRGHLDQVLLTFGFTFIFVDLVKTAWGATIKSLPVPELLGGVIQILGGPFPIYRLFLIGLGVGLAFLLWLLLERSRLGAMVRAGVDDIAMAMGLGINVPMLFSAVFGAGVALAALGGIAAAPVLGIYIGMDVEILIPAFVVIVIGGMGSLRGAFVGSLLVGVAETLGKTFVPGAAQFIIYMVMAAVLIVRPQGLFGNKAQVHRIHDVQFAGAITSSLSVPPRALYAAVVIALLVFPIVAGSYAQALATEIFIFAILAISLDLLLGYTGLMSLGHAAFFGVGAYSLILLGNKFGIDPWLGLVASVAAATIASILIGVLCIRTRSIAFLMLTMALSQMIFTVAVKWRDITGGSDGIAGPRKPHIATLPLSDPVVMYFTMLFFAVAVFWTLHRLVRSPLGLIFIGIRENESRMSAIGYRTDFYKLVSFSIGGAIAGLAGGLYAIYNGFISPEALYWAASGDILIMLVLGGIGTLFGPAIGAAIFLLMKNLVSSYSDHWMLIIGITFVAAVMFFPSGVWGEISRLLRGRRSA